jgi:hypothetical protein
MDDKSARALLAGYLWLPTHILGICNTYCFFPLQQWTHERVSVLCYTYIARLVGIYLIVYVSHSQNDKTVVFLISPSVPVTVQLINYNDAKTLSLGVKRLGCESNHSPHFEPTLRISGAITPIPPYDFVVCRDATLPPL